MTPCDGVTVTVERHSP